jgi:hypothetical protein
MSRFKSFLFDLSMADREAFAKKALSTVPYLRQIAYGNKHTSLGCAQVIVAQANAMGARLKVEDLPLCVDAKRQLSVLKKSNAGRAPSLSEGQSGLSQGNELGCSSTCGDAS